MGNTPRAAVHPSDARLAAVVPPASANGNAPATASSNPGTSKERAAGPFKQLYEMTEESLGDGTVDNASKYTEEFKYCPWFCSIMGFLYLGLYFGFAGSAVTSDGPVGGPEELWLMLYDRYCVDRRQEWWRLWTSSLVHANVSHLFGNVVSLMLLGLDLEMVHGALRIGILYNVGIVVGGCTSATFAPHSYVIGASGGIYTLMGARWANLALNWRSMPWRYFRLAVNLVVLAGDTANYFFMYSDGMSYSSHIGGWICGVFLGVVALRNLHRDPYEVLLQGAGAATLGCFLAFCLAWYAMHWPPLSPVESFEPMKCHSAQ